MPGKTKRKKKIAKEEVRTEVAPVESVRTNDTFRPTVTLGLILAAILFLTYVWKPVSKRKAPPQNIKLAAVEKPSPVPSPSADTTFNQFQVYVPPGALTRKVNLELTAADKDKLTLPDGYELKADTTLLVYEGENKSAEKFHFQRPMMISYFYNEWTSEEKNFQDIAFFSCDGDGACKKLVPIYDKPNEEISAKYPDSGTFAIGVKYPENQ